MATQVVRISAETEVPLLRYREQPVLTFPQIDTLHGRPEGTASAAFRRNRKRFIDGEDFYMLDSESLDVWRREFPDMVGANAPSLTLITESGYLMLVKPFTDDYSWQIQRQLVKLYFRVKAVAEQPAPQPTLSAEQQTELANQVRSIVAAWIYSSQTSAWIYNHLRVAFNVSRWQDIPESHYAAALALLNSKRAAAQEFLRFVNESRDWFNREVMGAGTPWTPALQRKLNAERGRRVPMPSVVDWRALDQQQTGQPPLAF